MQDNGTILLNTELSNQAVRADNEVKESLDQIKFYLEMHIRDLTRESNKKDNEIKYLKEALDSARNKMEGNTQLVNKLLGDLSKLQNDVEWYKLTYEKRSLLGTIREKLFRKH